MSEFVRIDLDKRAIDYIKGELSDGHELAHRLLDTTPWKTGSIYTYLPPQAESERLYQFKAGGKVRIPGLGNLHAQFIRDYLQARSDGIYVVEETDRKVSKTYYQGRSRQSLTIFEYHDTPYRCILSDDIQTDKQIRNAMLAGSYPNISVLSHLPDIGQRIQHHQQISTETLDLLVKNTDYVLIGVYDEEARLIWERQK